MAPNYGTHHAGDTTLKAKSATIKLDIFGRDALLGDMLAEKSKLSHQSGRCRGRLSLAILPATSLLCPTWLS